MSTPDQPREHRTQQFGEKPHQAADATLDTAAQTPAETDEFQTPELVAEVHDHSGQKYGVMSEGDGVYALYDSNGKFVTEYSHTGVFDLETTGIDPAVARIVTAYVGVLDEKGNIVFGREWMITPDGYEIPEAAANVHGVTTEQALAEGRPFAEVIPEILDALDVLRQQGIPIVAHNASYDFTLIAHEAARAGHEDPVSFVEGLSIIDTFVVDKQMDPYRKGKRTLTATAPVYGVELSEEEAHGAAADAIAAGRIAITMLVRPELAKTTPAELTKAQRGWSRAQRASLEAYRKKTDPGFTIDKNWPLYESALALRAPAEVYTF